MNRRLDFPKTYGPVRKPDDILRLPADGATVQYLLQIYEAQELVPLQFGGLRVKVAISQCIVKAELDGQPEVEVHYHLVQPADEPLYELVEEQEQAGANGGT